MRFRLKLTLFMIIIVNISLILLVIINTNKSYEIVETSVENSAIEIVKTQSSIVSEITVKQMQMPYYLSIDDNVIGFLEDQQSQEKFEKVTEMFDEYIFDKNNLEGVFLANSEGKIVVAQSANTDTIGFDLSDRDYYLNTMQEKQSVISETIYSKKTDEPMFVITVPVFSNDNQELIGFIGTVVLADSLSIYLNDMKFTDADTSDAFLIDGNGNYIYTRQEDLIGRPVKIREVGNLISQIGNSNSDTLEIINYEANEQKMMAVCSNVEGTEWLLVMTVSISELQEPIKNMNISMVVIFFLLSSVATFIIFFVAKFFTQPVIDALIDKNLKLEEFNQELEESQEKLKYTSERLTSSEMELKEQNQKLIESKDILDRKNELLEITLEASNDGIWYYEIIDNKNIPENFNPFMWSDKVIGSLKDWELLIHPEDRTNSQNQFREFLNGNISEFDTIHRVMNNDETYHWVRSKGRAFYNDLGERYILAGVHSDINELKKQEEQLNYLAYFDTLTDIPNRIQLLDRLEGLIASLQNSDNNLAVLFIDLDNFKRINDSMGHNFGDEVLKQAAVRLKEKKREFDIVSRFGGDEFVIVLANIVSKIDAYKTSNLFMDAFKEPFYIGQTKIFLNISLGIAVYPSDGKSAEELLTNADIAMYKAKKEGKNRVDFYDENVKNDVVKRLELEKDLRQAIVNSEFILHYQPQYNINNNTLRGFEALIRWKSPQNGIVGPLSFIDVAEDTGMIIQIGEWVIREACETMVRWNGIYGFNGFISVNISPVQIKHNNFVNSIKNILAQTGLDPQKLEIEITESILIESFDLTVEKLNELRKIGIRISLDDFGTGYSSLSYLKSLPVDTLKIDKSFIDEIREDSSSAEIVGSIINLVKKLKMETIAEGVETKEQYEYLKSVECDCCQGYYLSRPISENDVNEMIFEK